MKITIIGMGNMARGIGSRLVAGGNSVTLLGRDVEKAADLAAQLQAVARRGASAQAAPLAVPSRATS
jgi:3-hydroxyisobutyrate dehydrogenase-like beta-hydroxyacid dehydrogenase